jgi:hypothetical protein
MSSPLIHSFESFDDADAARVGLLSAGLPQSAIELRVIADEAGPVEGNFLVGNGRFVSGDPTRAGEQRESDAPPYGANFENAITRGVYLVIVDTDDGTARARATSLLAASPGRNLDTAPSQAGPGL